MTLPRTLHYEGHRGTHRFSGDIWRAEIRLLPLENYESQPGLDRFPTLRYVNTYNPWHFVITGDAIRAEKIGAQKLHPSEQDLFVRLRPARLDVT